MNIYKFIYVSFSCLLVHFTAQGQAIDTATILKNLVSDIKGLKQVAYDYSEVMEFPDGEKDRIQGKMVVDEDNKCISNDCDAFTVLYTQAWVYKADHRKKTLSIVKRQEQNSKKRKKTVEYNAFDNTEMNAFLDSVVMKKATVKEMIAGKDGMIKVILVFPENLPVKKMEFLYDPNHHLPFSYDIVVFHPLPHDGKKRQGITAKMHVSNITKPGNKELYDERKYFSLNNGKIELRKYNQYKLISKI